MERTFTGLRGKKGGNLKNKGDEFGKTDGLHPVIIEEQRKKAQKELEGLYENEEETSPYISVDDFPKENRALNVVEDGLKGVCNAVFGIFDAIFGPSEPSSPSPTITQ